MVFIPPDGMHAGRFGPDGSLTLNAQHLWAFYPLPIAGLLSTLMTSSLMTYIILRARSKLGQTTVLYVLNILFAGKISSLLDDPINEVNLYANVSHLHRFHTGCGMVLRRRLDREDGSNHWSDLHDSRALHSDWRCCRCCMGALSRYSHLSNNSQS